MPTKEDQVVPSERLLHEFEQNMLWPKFKGFDDEGLSFTPVKIIVSNNGIEKTVKETEFNKSVVKVAFYKTINPERFVVKSSVRLIEKHTESGVTGFNVKGEIRSGEAKVKGYTVVYNGPEFSGV